MERQDNSQDYVKKIYDELISRGLSTEEAPKIASQAYISDTPHIETITSRVRVIARCENCKHWDTGDEEPGELFLCNELLRESGKGKAKINIGGYDDYGLSVHTAKDFGCTLFERKGG